MRSYAHRLVAVEIDAADFEVLLAIARSPHRMIGSSSTRTPVAQRARDLARRELAQYISGARGGWSPGTWGAYPTCNGFNAMWRYAGDLHIDGCGSAWSADGTCTGCRSRRLLDLPAYEQYLAMLSDETRANELRTSALWCTEHGYIRQTDVTTQKICPLTGSPVHDGGLNRVGHLVR
ncbi:hypothetical protein ACNQR7_32170 [Mycolicibacterium senegalense]|uniref:hypothetical protein n=1 Tax=Mycolicibacterium senegalense TaxID=1796 RepID=UPI003AAE7211